MNVLWSVCQPTAWGIKGLGVRVSSENQLAVTQITCHVYPLAVAFANTARLTIFWSRLLGRARCSIQTQASPKIERRENHRSWLHTGKCFGLKQYQRVMARTPMCGVSGGFVRGKEQVWQIFGKTCDSHCASWRKTQESL